MVIRIAINGFGRIGRMVYRAMMNNTAFDVVAINDLTDTKTLAYLLKYDTVHGLLDTKVEHTADAIIVDGKSIPVFAKKDPVELPWKKLNVDCAVESTGFFTKREQAAKHLTAGAKKVLISGPSEDADKVIVMGVNEHEYEDKHLVVSNASCTTNCLAPMVKVLNDNFGLERGYMTTVHAYTADQRLVDAPHKDLRRARHAAENLVPTTTGAAKAVAQVIPALKGKLDGIAIRAPVPDGSVTDFVCQLKKNVTKEQINTLFSQVAQFHMKGVLEYQADEIVSSDIVGNRHSCIFDSNLTNVMDGNFVKIVGWYDNEWGYSNRMADVIKVMFHVK